MIRNITDFYKTDAVAYASYDNTRKISSCMDGLKISMRKVIHTMMNKYNTNEKTKTDTVANICAADTNYLHGSQNLCGVIETMTQSFVGANNYPLLCGNSSGFGTRINPDVAAPRYTKISIDPIIDKVLLKEDIEIVEPQLFEGSYIEPKFFLPVFPLLFLNGSSGLSTGYAQDICPRNPIDVIDYIKCKILHKTFKGDLSPWYKGFKGKIVLNPITNKYDCYGAITKNTSTSYTITEIPIGIGYQKYIDILNKLCDNKVIVDYEDNCDTRTDEISFCIKTTREFTNKNDTEDKLYSTLKLVKPLSETLCCLDVDSTVKEFSSAKEILDYFIEIRLPYFQVRKDHIIDKTRKKIEYLTSKYIFCSKIINGELIISNRKKTDIVEQLDRIDNIIKVDDNYNYLLNMPMHSVTCETINSLLSEIESLKKYLTDVEVKTIEQMWIEDLDAIKKYMKTR